MRPNLLGAGGRTRPELEELREKLAQPRAPRAMERSGGFSIATRSRAKKDRARQRAGSTGHREAARGLVRGTTDLDPQRLSLSTRLGPPPTWRACTGGAARPTAAHERAARPLENDDFRRRAAMTGMTAPMVLDGPINGLAFQAYVDQVLVRNSSPETSSSWTISDRTRAQASAIPSSRWRSASVSSPYSPDFNPIENAFANSRPSCEGPERTIEGLWTRIGECLPAFSPNECKNYFAAAGYDAT